jgi:glycine cleavage system aminomethyltransferase T
MYPTELRPQTPMLVGTEAGVDRTSTDFTISIACSVAYGVIQDGYGERKRVRASVSVRVKGNKVKAVTPADRWNCV